jgi:hypothetical protein
MNYRFTNESRNFHLVVWRCIALKKVTLMSAPCITIYENIRHQVKFLVGSFVPSFSSFLPLFLYK